MTSLAEIRARIAQQETKSTSQAYSGPSDNAIYPHWNMDEGTTATLRFLPDSDPNNTFFWVERQVLKLPFNGVKGDPNSKPNTIVQVPCVEMYGENCPVLAEVRTWFKDSSLEDMGRKYWKKRSYLFQGFVRQNPLGEDQTPANPIRRFIISPQIFTVIKNSLMDPEMENLPTDYESGVDFNVKKTSKGGYADYSTSNWSRRESALTEAEQAAVDAHGLFNLSDFLPKKPSEAELRVIKEMFEASVDGQPYDVERWGAYYRPYGVDAPTSSTGAVPQEAQVSAPAPAPAPAATTNDDVPFETSEPVEVPTESASKADDILAMIRARQSQ